MWKSKIYASLPSSDGDSQTSTFDSGFSLSSEKPYRELILKLYYKKWLRRCVAALLLVLCFVFGAAIGVFGRSLQLRYASSRSSSSSCISPVYRREWRTLSHFEKDAYISAVQCLSTQPSRLGFPHHSLADDFVWVHTHKGDDTLLAASFFPWHRYFLHAYEDALRTECYYSGHMPYWDWTLDWTDFHASPLFDPDTGFGGDGNASAPESVGHGHCVTEGPFGGMRVLYFDRDEQEHCFSRGMRYGEMLDFAMSKISPRAVEAVMQREDFRNFTYWLEKDTHKFMPYVFRGEWAQTSSNNDPIWYPGHVQLDRLWWKWQSMRPSTRFSEYYGNDFVGSGKAGRLSDVLDIGGILPAITVSEMMRTESDVLCYVY